MLFHLKELDFDSWQMFGQYWFLDRKRPSWLTYKSDQLSTSLACKPVASLQTWLCFLVTQNNLCNLKLGKCRSSLVRFQSVLTIFCVQFASGSLWQCSLRQRLHAALPIIAHFSGFPVLTHLEALWRITVAWLIPELVSIVAPTSQSTTQSWIENTF